MRFLALVLCSACATPSAKSTNESTTYTSSATHGGGDESGTTTTPPDDSARDSGETEVDLGVPVDLTVLDHLDCADPTERTRVGPGDYITSDPVLSSIPVRDPSTGSNSIGLAVLDLDNDGFEDIVATRHDGVWLLFGTPDGRWEDRTATHVSPPRTESTAGVLAVDIDDDGDRDLILAERLAAPSLYTNDGTGHFVRVDAPGFSDEALSPIMFSAGDLDGDGTLDIIAGGHLGGRNEDGTIFSTRAALYRGLGGTFEDWTAALPAEAHTGFTFQVAWLDIDQDGRDDLYFINDYGSIATPNVWLKNTSTPGTSALSSGSITGVELTMDGMGLAMGDLNDDGVLDLFITNWSQPRLLLSDGSGGYYESAVARGLVYDSTRTVGWGTALEDFDNDGDLDLWTTFGTLVTPSDTPPRLPNPHNQPDSLMLQGEDGRFAEVAPEWHLDATSWGRASVVTDLDHDGTLDVVAFPLDGPVAVWKGRCHEAAWLEVNVSQPPPNRDAVGVTVHVYDGDNHWLRTWRPGSTSFASTDRSELHFGLGDRDSVERLEVYWPDGATSTLLHVPTRQRIHIQRLAE